MQVLAILRHEEGAVLDPGPLVTLYSELGPRGATRVLDHAMEELAGRLGELMRHADAGHDVALMRGARLLVRMAEQVGMNGFARVAADVIAATRAGDRTALAAILTRLSRIADSSIHAVRHLRKPES